MQEMHEINKCLVCVVQVSTLKRQELPEIWVAAGESCSFLDKFSYVLSELPSKGELFSEQDRTDIQVICTSMHCIARGLLRELVLFLQRLRERPGKRGIYQMKRLCMQDPKIQS